MDGRQFDAVARALSSASTRRATIAGLLAAVLPFTAEARRRKQGGRDRRLAADGPCGDGGPKPNRCQRPRDCCTGICDKNAGRRYGRCRCRPEGQTCTASRNCCQRARAQVCQDGLCQPAGCAPNCACDPACEQEAEFCNPNTGTCCFGFRGACSVGADCCFDFGENTCLNDRCNVCNGEETACDFGGTCCSGVCQNGMCACQSFRETCSDVAQCCDYLTGSVACESDTCCRRAFGQCGGNGDCCSGVCCDGACCDGTCNGTTCLFDP